MNDRVEALKAEHARQREIFERQLRQYAEAKPRSRFAYAAHLTKTSMKLGQIEHTLENIYKVEMPPNLREVEILEARHHLGDFAS